MTEPYKAGNRLLVALPTLGQAINVQVVKMYPPTNAVALLVDNLSFSSESDNNNDLPPRAILKLADRRFGNAREEFLGEPAWPWTLDVERDFQAGLRAYIRTHCDLPDLNRTDEDEPTWMREFRHWDTFNFVHQNEKEAYSYLKDAQSRGYVPRFFGAVHIAMSSEKVHPAIDQIDGLLLEYIPGRTMGELQPGVDLSHEDAEEISQKVLTLGRRLRHYGVAHNDIHLNNIILRAPSNDPVLIDWGRAYLSGAHISAEENWENGNLIQDFQDDIRKILGRVWHRFSTPISDKAREEQAEKSNWRITNYTVSSRPPDELEKFYYRDYDVVDENSGLQWKVKPNVKTRGIYDAFEPLPEK